MTVQTRSSALPATVAKGIGVSAWFLRRVMRLLAVGHLVVHLPDGARAEQIAPRPGPDGTLVLHNWRAVRRLLVGGHMGFAEAYIDGDWSSPDLAALIELAACNQQAIGRMIEGLRLPRLRYRLRRTTKINTKRGSRRNIEAHYDLGNDFYREWLDRGMTYSSALYNAPALTLEAAQAAKQARVMQMLDLSEGQSVLEIGSGWGGLAEALIRTHNCHVTGVTLSPAQLDFSRTRLMQPELSGRYDMRLQDYRDVGGQFDRIVSIEMLEAVGARYWPAYFERLRSCLKQGGVAVLQVITIDERLWESYCRDADFIQRHIFPGGMLPTRSVLAEQVTAAGLVLQQMEHFGESYARTLREWSERFAAAWPRLSGMGFDDRFRRKWEYYLAYCEAGFRAGAIDVGLYRLGHAG